MADFPTALDRALTAHYGVREDFRSPVESTRGFKARVGALERAYKTQRAAAAAAGIDPTTWGRWKSGKQTPGRASLLKVAAAHMALLRAVKVARRGYPSRIDVEATVAARPKASLGRNPKKNTYYNGGSAGARNAHRKFRADRLTATQLADVVNAWAAGARPVDVADALMREIERAYPGRFEFEGNDVTVTITG